MGALLPMPDLPDGKVRNPRLPAVHFRIYCDTHRFAPAQIEAFARELEAIVVAATFDAELLTGVRRRRNVDS